MFLNCKFFLIVFKNKTLCSVLTHASLFQSLKSLFIHFEREISLQDLALRSIVLLVDALDRTANSL